MPRPGVVVLAVVACAVGGATANHCWTCGTSRDARPLPPVAGRPLDAPLPDREEAEAETVQEAPELTPGVLALSFDLLGGFTYEHPDSPQRRAGEEAVPERITKLDGKQVAITGYMLPLGSGEKITRFLLIRYPFGCCFGVAPRVNEWVDVTTREPVDFVPHEPVTVFGELDVGEELENEAVMSLYRIAATTVELPLVYR